MSSLAIILGVTIAIVRRRELPHCAGRRLLLWWSEFRLPYFWESSYRPACVMPTCRNFNPLRCVPARVGEMAHHQKKSSLLRHPTHWAILALRVAPACGGVFHAHDDQRIGDSRACDGLRNSIRSGNPCGRRGCHCGVGWITDRSNGRRCTRWRLDCELFHCAGRRGLLKKQT
jgi:hypothetical protein